MVIKEIMLDATSILDCAYSNTIVFIPSVSTVIMGRPNESKVVGIISFSSTYIFQNGK